MYIKAQTEFVTIKKDWSILFLLNNNFKNNNNNTI